MANQVQNKQAGRYQPYPEYKNSGVEWLEKIPSHWDLWKLKHAYSNIGSGTTPPTSSEEWFYKGTIPWVTTGELRENIITHTNKYLTNKAYGQFSALRIYPAGSIVIAMYGATIGRLGILGIPATTNQACCVICHSTKIDNKYLFYWLYAFRNEIINLSSGGGQPNINQEKVSFLKISAPLKKEQTQIAQFLDYETAKIDLLIEKQQKLIELLKEKRQAVISHAVTKGLDPNVEMKDSGVEWLGEVPAHWEISKFPYEIDFKEGPGILAVDFQEKGIPLLRIQNIKEHYVTTDYKNFLSPRKVLDKWHHFMVEEGDLIISGSASTDLISEVLSNSAGAIPYTGLIRLRPRSNRISKSYIRAIIQAHYFKYQINVLQTGSTIQHFGPIHLQQIFITLPSASEQTQIAEYLDIQTSKIDLLIEKAEAQIALMQERRTALISAAVTGKIDLRHWQMPEGSDHQGGDNE